MPLPKHVLEEIGRVRLAEQREAERITRREYVRAIGLCLFWLAVGLSLVGWALHTTDVREAHMAFWGGLALGNGGILHTLAGAYLRGERRGDW